MATLGITLSALSLESPDGRLQVWIDPPNHWSARFVGEPLFEPSLLSLSVSGEGDLLEGAKLLGHEKASRHAKIAVLFGRNATAEDRYQELLLKYESRQGTLFNVVFRCYDDAIAFRYEIPSQKDRKQVTIADEGTTFALSGDPTAYVQYLENYKTSHEHPVDVAPMSKVRPDTLLDLPLTLARDGRYVAITEAALRAYAGMALMREESALRAKLTPKPDGNKVVTDLPMKSPWRVALVADRIGALLETDTIYCLNEPNAIGDLSWIKPGKITWPWWNGNLTDPERPAAIFSMESQRRHFDFCAEGGIAYHAVVSDEADKPWYVQEVPGLFPGPGTDVTRVRPDLDMEPIRDYAKEKGIGLWTWVHQGALKGRVEEAFAAFEKIGWDGMMVDFFDHDDQETVEFAEEILKAAAKRRIRIHFHGIWKPNGLQRTYPNLMNHEGALNLEYLKWSDACTPGHTLRLAFTRLIAGPMDYHLGGFRAVKRSEFKPINIGPNVLGTRGHQLAMYVCLDNPTPMVADYPAAYRDQPGFDFVSMVPTWWDETRVLQAEIGSLLVTARRKGQTWYVGGLSAGPGREVKLPLKWLRPGKFTARIWSDTPETEDDPNRIGSRTQEISATDIMNLDVAPDGGFVIRIDPRS
ncbi:MAG TPA: glycoside hydrolase family 97 protein [Fimbriimonas sp.]